MRDGLVVFPQFTAEDGNPGCVPLRLPTSRQEPRKFRFIAQNQYASVSHKAAVPKVIARNELKIF
jgi:hypothetical protein